VTLSLQTVESARLRGGSPARGEKGLPHVSDSGVRGPVRLEAPDPRARCRAQATLPEQLDYLVDEFVAYGEKVELLKLQCNLGSRRPEVGESEFGVS